ncbi:phosphatidylserine decarboxylase [Evansella sp. AB-rgal1]|uniref:phosphatidylserine decarboxylase n=1 Tax=Evansella sp. AB-rgal1 TaxID=3242696 RepID=UPI00359E0CBA
MKRELYKTMVELTQNPLYTNVLKRFATSRISGKLTKSFANVYKINHEEHVGNIADYRSLHEYFIRELKEGVRPIDQNERSVVSPVDGVLSQFGVIEEQATFHVKGKDYSLSTMLGLEKTSERYIGGTYMLFYLSPRDYHRIHSPLSGEVVKRYALGKYSEPVNQMGLLLGDYPLAKNYRLITEVEKNGKRVAVVKIGALNVNSVQPSHLDTTVNKGEELAYFTFGSTVVLLFEKGMIVPTMDDSDKDIQIQHGQPVGIFV